MANDTIQYKRYNACICSFLTSGTTGVRYRYKEIGKARVFYPYVLNEQFERFNKGQGIISCEKCQDKTTADFADWNKFLLCFSPEGFVDKDCDYLVFISDGEAGYVPLVEDIKTKKPIDALKDKERRYIDLQDTLINDLSNAGNEFHGYSIYYRNRLDKGSFIIYKQPVPFNVLYPILQSGTFTKEALFIQNTLGVASTYTAEEVRNYLDTNRNRFINGVSRHWKQEGAKDILNKEWCLHTRLLFEQYTKQKLTDKQAHLVEMILGYCNKRLTKSDLVSKRGGIPHLSFFKPEIDVKKLYAALVRAGFISADIGEENFTYYMTGRGKAVPTEKIEWHSTNASLIGFIYAVEGYGNCEWSVVSKVFLGSKSKEISADSLRTSFHKTFTYAKKKTNLHFFKDFVNKL